MFKFTKINLRLNGIKFATLHFHLLSGEKISGRIYGRQEEGSAMSYMAQF
jgi:hypothetical protein